MFRPKDTAFTATGSITVTAGAVSLPCTAVLQGTTTTKPHVATITAATFSGLSCALLTPSGLPWTMLVSNANSAIIYNASVSALVIGICGPGNVPVTLDANGVITISGAGLPGSVLPCSISGSLSTSPRLKIVAK